MINNPIEIDSNDNQHIDYGKILLQGQKIQMESEDYLEELEEGSFEKNDVPSGIYAYSNVIYKKEETVFRLEWQNRPSGQKLEDSYISYNCLKQKNPQLLLKFFEQWFDAE